ncbi:MAG: monovalent cation/H(+) antiporter subunit G [Giesbergeria sp.]|nr:monovalent cation/H(+) antiporter subunit G [Giesbergeria sp.]
MTAPLETLAPLLPLWAEITVAALVLMGALVALLGSFGLLRLRSFFERVHAPAIIATLGCWCVMYGALLYFSFRGQGLAVHLLLIAVFIAVTVPITTIFLMRASLFRARQMGKDVPPSLSSPPQRTPNAGR